MKFLKKALIVLVPLILILLYIPKHLPTHFAMSRSVVIKAPVSKVFEKLPDLNEYVKWNPFQDGDKSHVNEISGSGAGSFLTWKGEKSGEGKMTIESLEPNHKVKIKMDFYKPMKGEGIVYWITTPTPDGNTELKWTFDQDLPYLSRYFGLVMDSMMGKHFERGLNKYKYIIETSK